MTELPRTGAARASRQVASDTGPGRANRRGVIAQLAAKVVHLVLNVVSTLAVLRYLGADNYGAYVLILTLTTFAGVVADFGLPRLAIRELVRDSHQTDAIVGSIVVLRLVLVTVAGVLLQLILLAMSQPPPIHLAGLFGTLAIACDAILGILLAVFHVHLQQPVDAAARVGAESLELLLVLLLIAQGAALEWLFFPPLAGLALAMSTVALLARRRHRLRPRVDRGLIRPLAKEAAPLGAALIVSVLYLRLDALVIAAVLARTELGQYGAAYQPVEYLFLASAVLINVLYPMSARAFASGDRDRGTVLYRSGAHALFVITLALPCVVLAVATDLVTFVYGNDFAGAAMPFVLLTVALVFMTLNAWQASILLAAGHQRVTLRVDLGALAVAFIVCPVLVQLFGIRGAATSAILTGIFVAITSGRALKRLIGATLDFRRSTRLVVCSLLALALGLGLNHARSPWPVTLAVTALCYGLLAHRLGHLRAFREALS